MCGVVWILKMLLSFKYCYELCPICPSPHVDGLGVTVVILLMGYAEYLCLKCLFGLAIPKNLQLDTAIKSHNARPHVYKLLRTSGCKCSDARTNNLWEKTSFFSTLRMIELQDKVDLQTVLSTNHIYLKVHNSWTSHHGCLKLIYNMKQIDLHCIRAKVQLKPKLCWGWLNLECKVTWASNGHF